MAKTAVVNPRRKRKRKSTRRYGSRRRRNPTRSNPRRRRARRRNPTVQSVYSRGGYRKTNPRRRSSRRRNPEGYFDIDKLTEVVPAATLGVQVARFAFHVAGPLEPGEVNPSGGPGAPMPGIKHAIAAVVAAQFGSKVVGDVLGSDAKGAMAGIAALGFAGDQFLHKRFMVGSKFASDHLYLGDADGENDWEPDEDLAPSMNGFENQSAIGNAPRLVQGSDGQWYQLEGFENESALGYDVAPDVSRRPIAAGGSSFGYSRC